jgi:2-polyprenyl-3-methyl-5-hydroxy-6-metoxy-1,4-benzoquinol methylase
LSDYIGEARFGAVIIDAEMAQLPQGARILEVGAGMLLLSCALQSAGYQVSAVEPVGIGFSHINRLREIVWNYATALGCCPDLRPIKAEQLMADAEFEFAFSMNVMEHVEDAPLVLRRVLSALRAGATYHFVCPNYRFPYEPHFDMPTLFSKWLTGRVFRSRILGSRTVIDPAGTWESLNWISVASVRRMCRHLGVEPEFDRTVAYRYLRRAIGDPSFQRRHSGILSMLGTSLDAIGVTRLLMLLPAGAQPAMSCRVTTPRLLRT